jgi:L-malate glycosyltransferase
MSKQKLLKIGVVCYPTQGGSGVVAVELAHEMADRGHEVHVISYATPVRLNCLKKNIFFHIVKVPDYPLFEYPPYSLALATKVADTITQHDLDVLHVHYAIPHAISGWLARKISGNRTMPVIATLHGTDITIIGKDPSYLKATSFSLEMCDSVTVVSDWLREKVKDIVKCTCRIKTIHNFVDPEVYKPSKSDISKTIFGDDKLPVLMHMSNFRPVKRVSDVIDTYLMVREKMPVRLIMIGDGPDRQVAESKLNSSPYADDVCFLGPQRNTEEILPAADIFIFPSNAESFGLAALEAQACGVPVIGWNVGGLPEVVKHEETGFLHELFDVKGMAESCVKLLGDKKLYKQMSVNSRVRAVKHFTPANIVDKYEELYYSSIKQVQEFGLYEDMSPKGIEDC